MDPHVPQSWSTADHMDQVQLMNQDMDFTSLLDLDDIALEQFLPIADGLPSVSMQQEQQQQQHFDHFSPTSYLPSTGHPIKHGALHIDQEMYYHPQETPPTPTSYQLEGSGPAYHTHHSLTQQSFDQTHSSQSAHGWVTAHSEFAPLISPAVAPKDAQAQGIRSPSNLPSPISSPAFQGKLAAHAPNGGRNPESRTGSILSRSTSLHRALSGQGQTSGMVKDKAIAIAPAQPTKQSLRPLQPYPPATVSSLTAPEPRADKTKMGPPPKPGKDYKSPRLLAQLENATSATSTTASVATPATPATPMSLMSLEPDKEDASSLAQKRSVDGLAPLDTALNDLALPPAARTIKLEAPARVTKSSSGEIDFQVGQRKTPKLGPLDTPSSASRNGSAASSPQMVGIARSHSVAGTPRTGKSATTNSSRKRGASSACAPSSSPALMPKISPSIKPLLPSGNQSPIESNDTMLLATKSNYQNLLQGTLLPGVSYPESLTSGLTSKRTSHKIAEQDRRTRINDALKQLQSLLPAPVVAPPTPSTGAKRPLSRRASTKSTSPTVASPADGAADTESAERAASATSSLSATSNEARIANSKAATVENAIDYITKLQNQIETLKASIAEKDGTIQELRKVDGKSDG